MKLSNVVMAIVCFVGVFSMNDKDFAPLVFFWHIGVVMITAITWSFIAEHYINKFKRRNNGMGVGSRYI